jgi:hypothetical protein
MQSECVSVVIDSRQVPPADPASLLLPITYMCSNAVKVECASATDVESVRPEQLGLNSVMEISNSTTTRSDAHCGLNVFRKLQESSG